MIFIDWRRASALLTRAESRAPLAEARAGNARRERAQVAAHARGFSPWTESFSHSDDELRTGSKPTNAVSGRPFEHRASTARMSHARVSGRVGRRPVPRSPLAHSHPDSGPAAKIWKAGRPAFNSNRESKGASRSGRWRWTVRASHHTLAALARAGNACGWTDGGQPPHARRESKIHCESRKGRASGPRCPDERNRIDWSPQRA